MCFFSWSCWNAVLMLILDWENTFLLLDLPRKTTKCNYRLFLEKTQKLDFQTLLDVPTTRLSFGR